jgi:hypothetical protein
VCDVNHSCKFSSNLVGSGSACVLDTGKQRLLSRCIDGRQRLSSGYRKKTGNQCAGGTDLEGEIISCGTSSSSSGRGFFGWIGWSLYWMFYIAFWTGLVVLIIFLFYRYKYLIPGFGEGTGRIR